MIKFACWLSMLFLTSASALAQNYKVLYSFAGPQAGDGASPQGDLILDASGNLYGTTYYGGATPGCPDAGCGTVFKLSPNQDGTWSETIIYSFCSDDVNFLCTDGRSPVAGLIHDGEGNLYGTTNLGGTISDCPQGGGCGTVFELSPPAAPGGTWTENVLYSFCSIRVNNTCMDGVQPASQVTLDASGNLYGTTTGGGTGNSGLAFELSPGPDGWTETVLHSFCANGHGNACPDGAFPYAGVTLDAAGNLYGTTRQGGTSSWVGGGTVYELSSGPDGWTEKVLFAFFSPFARGAYPLGAVSFDSAGNLYSTTSIGGPQFAGGVFRLSSKNGGNSRTFVFDGHNGDFPSAGVLVSQKTGVVYGTTLKSETNQDVQVGNVFKIGPSGTETVLYAFCQQTNCTDGEQPEGGLVANKSGTLYGTTQAGGGGGAGVVFEITP